MILFYKVSDNRMRRSMRQVILGFLLLTPVFAVGQTLPATMSTTLPTTIPADSPRAAYERLVVAMQQGDGQTIRQLIEIKGDDEQRLVDSLVSYSQSVARLRQAAVETYGAASSRGLTGDPAEQEKRLIAIRQAQQQIDGDHATLKVNSPDTPVVLLRLVDGQWRVPLREMLPNLEPAQVAQQVEETTLQVRAFDETTADILEGKYHTADEAAQALRGRLIRPTTEPAVPTTAATRPG